MAGYKYDLALAAACADLLYTFQAAHLGHLDIHYNYIGIYIGDHFYGFSAIPCSSKQLSTLALPVNTFPYIFSKYLIIVRYESFQHMLTPPDR